MNFYRAQDQARKQTRWLLVLFLLAVISLVLITNLCVAVFVWFSDVHNYSSGRLNGLAAQNMVDLLGNILTGLGWYKFAWITVLVLGVILLSILFKWLSLRGGGRVVAESLGGKLLAPNSDRTNERRLLNIVEEMALASGGPVPPGYVLDRELGINAFAAGLSVEDAVIGVTQGTLERLNREQLQGVIAHEFSHILNGDMNLNIKIVAILHGILMIGEAGRMFISHSTRSSGYRSRRQGNGLAFGFLLFGLCLTVIGWLGEFFGAMIRSAVCRQREYLADASAVQFTRNPEGIGGALKIIGGFSEHSRVAHSGAHELGHFFFSKAYASLFSLFSTHPPLELRIKRILPSWNGRFLAAPEPQSTVFSGDVGVDISQRSALNEQGAYEFTLVTPVAAVNPVSASAQPVHVTPMAIDYPAPSKPDLRLQAREPEGAVALILALLMAPDEATRQRQVAALTQADGDWFIRVQLPQLHQALVALTRADAAEHLSLVELAIPALKTLSLAQYRQLRGQMSLLINADGEVALFEWALYQLVKNYCDRHFEISHNEPPKYKTLHSVSAWYQLVLSRLAHYSSADPAAQVLAFNRGCHASGLTGLELLPVKLCSLSALARAAHQLARAYPLLKPRLLKGLIATAQTDSQINADERQLITAVAAVLDCPLVGLE